MAAVGTDILEVIDAVKHPFLSGKSSQIL